MGNDRAVAFRIAVCALLDHGHTILEAYTDAPEDQQNVLWQVTDILMSLVEELDAATTKETDDE